MAKPATAPITNASRHAAMVRGRENVFCFLAIGFSSRVLYDHSSHKLIIFITEIIDFIDDLILACDGKIGFVARDLNLGRNIFPEGDRFRALFLVRIAHRQTDHLFAVEFERIVFRQKP